jgi:hypothetical protein
VCCLIAIASPSVMKCTTGSLSQNSFAFLSVKGCLKTISLSDQHSEIVVSREDNRVAIPLRGPGGKASKARSESPARLELLSSVNNSFFSLNPNCV